MSRSIHATWREYARLSAEDFSRPERKREELRALRASLRRKRRIKLAVLSGRALAGEGGAGDAALVPIQARDGGPYVHHLAGEDNVRQVLLRLPRGVADGLRRVELRLGALSQPRGEEAGGAEPDPLTGRVGYDWVPGVWCGRILGTYARRSATIWVNAYVYDRAAQPLAPVWEVLLRAYALSTFVHEMAHHHDATQRRARGRWRMDGERTVEMYAEARQHEWAHGVVVPYLRERYPADVARLEAWIAEHGGVALPFEALVDDPRETNRDGTIRFGNVLWTMREAVANLVSGVMEGIDATARRTHFARDLHFHGMRDEALAVLAGVLGEHPGHTEALVLRADIFVHQGRHADALAIVEPIVRAEPGRRGAWQVVMQAHEGLGHWRGLVDAATRLLEMDPIPSERVRLLARRGVAKVRAGDRAGAEADLAAIEALGALPGTARSVQRLRDALAAEDDRACA